MGWLADETGLDKNPANFVPLIPTASISDSVGIPKSVLI